MENEELDQFLGSDAVEEDETDVTEEEVAEEETPEEEASEEPEKPKAEEPKEEPEEKTVPLAALQSERREKRELAERLERLERQVSQPQQEAPKAPDMFSDPDGFQRYLSQQMASVASNTQLNISEDMAREAHGDEVVEAALAAAKEAGVAGQFSRQRHPWGAMVKWHQQQQQMAEIAQAGGLEAYTQRIKEQARAEALREAQAEAVVKDAQSARAPSLAGKPNLGTRQGQEWAGPTPLDDILTG